MLRSRWPGTVVTVTLDTHCQFILEVAAKSLELHSLRLGTDMFVLPVSYSNKAVKKRSELFPF